MSTRLNPLKIYNLLPKTNCGKCGESSCMAFAVKLIERAVKLNNCLPLYEEEKYVENKRSLEEILTPPVRPVTIGEGDKAVTLGGEEVMYRHELTYYNPTAIAIEVTDDMTKEELLSRISSIETFRVERAGTQLKLDMIAVRSVTGDPSTFARKVATVVKKSSLPIILCSTEPDVLEAAVIVSKDRKPLIYAATESNYQAILELAQMYDTPVVCSSSSLDKLCSIVNEFVSAGVTKIVLDPGTFPDNIAETVSRFTLIRKLSTKHGNKLLGFPLMGVPASVWLFPDESVELTKIKEAWLASMLILRYASLLIMHSLDVWVLLPILTLKQNIYTDPRKPVAVEPGLKEVGSPNENSPVLLTTNFSLTYYSVKGDLESAKINSYVLVVDTEGLAVRPAVAGKKLTAKKVAEFIKSTDVENKVKHRKLIIPRWTAVLKGELEDATGWEIIVGPADSSELPKFLRENWNSTS